MTTLLLVFLLIYGVMFHYLNKWIITNKMRRQKRKLATQLKYYGYHATTLLYCVLLVIFAVIAFCYYLKLIPNLLIAYYLSFAAVIITSIFILVSNQPQHQVNKLFENNIRKLMLTTSSLACIVTVLIVFSIFFETYSFFKVINIVDFFTGTQWNPTNDLNDPEISRKFGIIPLLSGTLLITVIALAIATPIGLLSAIFLAEYVSNGVRFLLKPIIEMLSGIPTVIYGYFAALYVGPYVRELGYHFGLEISSESSLSAGIVLGIMIIPYIVSLSDDVLKSIPSSIREASLALGATQAETIVKVVIPAAKSGLIGAIMLAFSRAIGETMIVTMASGLTARLTGDPFDSVTTITAQIVSILTGDQEYGSIQTLAAYALAFTLFCVTLCINIVAQKVIYQSKNVFR